MLIIFCSLGNSFLENWKSWTQIVIAYKGNWDNADNQEYKLQMCSRDERGKCGWQIQQDED